MSNPKAAPQTPKDLARTLLILGRVSNLPTLWTNIILGISVAYHFGRGGLPAMAEWAQLFPFFVGACFLYLFGMYANDWADVEWDKKHAKQRPIPAGAIDRGNVGFLALFWLFSGLALTWQGGWWTCLLVAAISIYTWVHKKTSWSIIPMALCRFALVMMAGSLAGELVWWPAVSLAGYLLLLTAIARNEHRLSKYRLVGYLLAGICLHDALWLGALGLWWPALVCFLAFPLCLKLQRTIPAS